MTNHDLEPRESSPLPGPLFLEELQTNGGNLTEFAERHPELILDRMIGDGNPRITREYDPQTEVIPYSAKFGGGRNSAIKPIEFETGMSIRAVGGFHIAQTTADISSLRLMFTPGGPAQRIDLGAISQEEAAAINALGPAKADITLTLTDEPAITFGGISKYRAHFDYLNGVQGLTPVERVDYQDDENLLIDGEVVGYEPARSLPRAIGAAALTDIYQTQTELRQTSALQLRLADGSLVSMVSEHSYSNLHYLSSLPKRPAPDYPMIGDKVRVAAFYDSTGNENDTQAIQLQVISLQQPSYERNELDKIRQQQIDQAIATINETDETQARDDIAKILELSVIKQADSTIVFDLTAAQHQQLSRVADRVFADNFDEYPLALGHLEVTSDLGYAASEDRAILAMTKAEYKDYVHQQLVGQQDVDEATTQTYRFIFAEEVYNDAELVDIARSCWQDIKNNPAVDQISAYQLHNLVHLFNDVISIDAANLTKDIVLSDKLAFENAYELLRNSAIIGTKEHDIGLTELKICDVYIDTFNELHAAYLEAGSPVIPFGEGDVQRSYERLAAQCYLAVRRMRLLPS